MVRPYFYEHIFSQFFILMILGIRLNDWNTIPNTLRRKWVSSAGG